MREPKLPQHRHQNRTETSRGSLPLLDGPMAIILRHQGRVPTDVDAIARDMGLSVKHVPMGLGRSGAIYRDPESPGQSGFTIEIDSEESRIRQRFTLAHEIAHYVLHRDLMRVGEKVVDNAMYRSQLSTDYESQANRLAADIVMPKNRVREHFGDDPDPASLAKKFEVSQQAMEIRIKHLGLT